MLHSPWCYKEHEQRDMSWLGQKDERNVWYNTVQC